MDEKSAPPLRTKVLQGAAWMVAIRWSHRLLGLVSVMILARLLTPHDFGTVAIVMSIVSVVDAFLDFGFDVSLIKNQNTTRDDFDVTWTMRLIKTLLFALIIAMLLPFVASYANAPETIQVGLVIALTVAIRGLDNIGTIQYQKDLDFGQVFRFRVYPRLLGVITTIILAFTLRSYWAIAFGMLASTIYGVAFSYIANPYRPRLRFQGIQQLWRFSQWIMIGNMGRQLFSMADRFLLSGWVDKAQLGFFTVAADVSSIVTVELLGPVSAALMPGFAKLQHEKERLRNAFMMSISVFTALILPSSVGVWLVAPEIVRVILGVQWHDSAKFVGMFGWFFMFFSLSEILTSFLIMVGLVEKSARISLGRSIFYLAALFFVFQTYHIEGIILFKIAFAVIEVLLLFYLSAKYLNLPASAILQIAWRPLLSSACMIFAVQNASHAIHMNALADLCAKVLIGALVYITVSLTLWAAVRKPKGIESITIELAENRLRWWRQRKQH